MIRPAIDSTHAYRAFNKAEETKIDEVERGLTNYDHLSGDRDLDRALSDCTRALEDDTVASNNNLRARWTILRATALRLRFERSWPAGDLESAQELLEATIEAAQPGSHIYAQALYQLGRSFEASFDHRGTTDTLFRSRDCYRKAMEQTAAPQRLLDEVSVHLGRTITSLALTLHGEGDLSEAISLISGVVQRTDESDPLRALGLAYLCQSYRWRWRFGDLDDKSDLLKSNECGHAALDCTPTHRYRPLFLQLLSLACSYLGTPEAVKESMDLAKQSVEHLQGAPPVKSADRMCVITLAIAYADRFEAEGQLADLDECVKYQQLLADLDASAEDYVNLCGSVLQRFEITGRGIHLDEAITAGYKAMARAKPNTIGMDNALFHLGRAHALRFMHAQDDSDFCAAQLHLKRAIENREANTPFGFLHAFSLSQLATAYSHRFDISLSPDDLDLAVKYGQGSVACKTGSDHYDAELLSLLGRYLAKRFEVSSQTKLQDLEDSISSHETAISLSGSGYYERHIFLWQYGHALQLRYKPLHRSQDFRKCIEVLKEALEHAQRIHHPNQCLYLSELAAAYLARHQLSRLHEDADTSLAYYADAAQCSEGFTGDRFRAALSGARFAQEQGRLRHATQAFATAVSFLPKLAWLGLNASKRHAKLVSTASQLACDAAASAVMSGDLDHAVELLEEGRSVLWRSVLELRTDLKELETVSPELAQELVDVGQALEDDDMSSGQIPESHLEEHSQRRRRTAERWDSLLERVRKLPGFEAFLKPLAFSALQLAARDGPIVILNVSQYLSNAMIISMTKPTQSIPLPGLDYTTIRQLVYKFIQALTLARDEKGCKFLEGSLISLSTRLWDGGLAAVAAALLHGHSYASPLPPRVWWLPTGLFSLLPVHCAGSYQANRLGISDLFISSYTTTLTALLTARKSSAQTNVTHSPRMLAIGLKETPGWPHLPCTGMELQVLQRSPAFSNSFSCLKGHDATVQAVTEALPNYEWIHACCHAHWNPSHPLDSAFQLMDGPLTLSSIGQMRLKHADFAFLSACHTARHTTILPDEAMHLAAGLQVAGYKGLLASRWSMADRDGPILAECFYSWLTVGGRPVDVRNAAEALHMAVRKLREFGMPLYRWAAFVHIGV